MRVCKVLLTCHLMQLILAEWQHRSGANRVQAYLIMMILNQPEHLSTSTRAQPLLSHCSRQLVSVEVAEGTSMCITCTHNRLIETSDRTRAYKDVAYLGQNKGHKLLRLQGDQSSLSMGLLLVY